MLALVICYNAQLFKVTHNNELLDVSLFQQNKIINVLICIESTTCQFIN